MSVFKPVFSTMLAGAMLGIAMLESTTCFGAITNLDNASSTSAELGVSDAAYLEEFGGGAASRTAALISYLPGDANRDRAVGFIDLGLLLNNYLQPGTWTEGNFNSDNLVDFSDLGTLLNNYGNTGLFVVDPEPQIVPEPNSGVVWGLLGCLALSGEFLRRQANRRKTSVPGL